jgi:pimeloyl-ACP methyl ester carboxylesterase
VKRLSLMGQFEANGERVLKELTAWYTRWFPQGNVPIALVGHSAGGFYSMYAATKARNLPIRKLVMISTPLLGAELADAAFHAPVVGKVLTEICDHSGGILDLRGLTGLTSDQVEGFLKRVALPDSLELFTLGGSQPRPSGPLDATRAEVLSPAFAMASLLIPTESDGIISLRSSMGVGAQLVTQSGQTAQLNRPALRLNLDHAEQALDYRVFGLLGTRDAGYIRQEQQRAYAQIARFADPTCAGMCD